MYVYMYMQQNYFAFMYTFVFLSIDMPDTEMQLTMSQLFSSPLCERLLANCVREVCLTRLGVARDILLLICLLQHGEVCRLALA